MSGTRHPPSRGMKAVYRNLDSTGGKLSQWKGDQNSHRNISKHFCNLRRLAPILWYLTPWALKLRWNTTAAVFEWRKKRLYYFSASCDKWKRLVLRWFGLHCTVKVGNWKKRTDIKLKVCKLELPTRKKTNLSIKLQQKNLHGIFLLSNLEQTWASGFALQLIVAVVDIWGASFFPRIYVLVSGILWLLL